MRTTHKYTTKSLFFVKKSPSTHRAEGNNTLKLSGDRLYERILLDFLEITISRNLYFSSSGIVTNHDAAWMSLKA